MKHLYVHIPFCRSRCGYCDFASEPLGPHLRAGRVDAYLDALRAELADRGASLELPVETIYLGGGTPTALPRRALLELVADLAALQQPGAADAAAEAAGGPASQPRAVSERRVRRLRPTRPPAPALSPAPVAVLSSQWRPTPGLSTPVSSTICAPRE